MSDSRSVKSDTKSGEIVMRAITDTEGLSVPARAEFWLQKLATHHHRGRHDTWTAARDRAAAKAGIPTSTAKRIWQRWETMNDVGGDALLKLMLAYEGICGRTESAAEAVEGFTQHLKAERNATYQSRDTAGESTGAARD